MSPGADPKDRSLCVLSYTIMRAQKKSHCENGERVAENNEHCESLSVQDEDSTSPAMLEGKRSKLKVSKPRVCRTGKDPQRSMGEGLGKVSPISKGAVPVL